MGFGKIAASVLTLAGGLGALSYAAYAQTRVADLESSELACRASFSIVNIMNEDGETIPSALRTWAMGFSSEAQLAACEDPPLYLVLRAQAMLGKDGGGDAQGVASAEKLASYLKQTQNSDQFYDWVQPLMEGDVGPVAGRTALYWLEHAAEIGDPRALYELSGVYELGAFHIAKNPAKAVELERMAADKGSAIAMYALGVRYLQGVGVKASTKTGLDWIARAAEHGYEDAVLWLATAYDGSDDGAQYGVRANRKRAQHFGKLAAQSGNTKAMALYASMLLRDPKSIKHEDEVFYWLNRAADEGDADVAAILAQVGPKLRENYRKSRERKASLRKPIFKQCPEVQRCTVYTNQYGPTGEKYCAPQRDYWNCG